jgi:2-methylisocitrate lyase-like PEP mutase family enzyme
MNPDQRRALAERLRALHQAPPILILPNAWDVASAKVYEKEGFQAIATTSAGIASALGYPDGQRISLEEHIEIIRRIAVSCSVPVSADIEAGYAIDPEGVARTVSMTAESGAVGVNLEDGKLGCGGAEGGGLFEPGEQVERVAAARQAADSSGIPMVINARTDVFLYADDPERRIAAAVSRGNAYRQAGADCIFVPDLGDLDEQTMSILVREIEAPLNVIAGTCTPPVARLEEIGVARVSFGPRPMRAVLSLLREIAREWTGPGTYEKMARSTLTYDQLNRWFEA